MNNNRLEDSAKFYCHMGLLLLALVGVTWCLLLLKYAIPISFAETGLMADLLLGVIITGSLAYLCLRIKKQGLAARTEFDMLFLKNPYPMWIYDVASLKFLQVNDAACSMYGYSREEFLNMTIAEIRPAEDVPALLNETEQVRAEFSLGYMWSGTWRHKKKDGTMIYSEISSHKIIFQGRRASLILCYDVTGKVLQESKLLRLNQELEQKVNDKTHDLLLLNKTLVEQNKTIRHANQELSKLSEALQAANEQIKKEAELKSRFVSMVSHEFKTPLSTIRFAADFISRYHSRITPDQLLDKVNNITRQINHMDVLINDVVTVGRNNTQSIKAIKEPLLLENFISGIVREVQSSTNHSHNINCSYENPPQEVFSDEKLMRNIFINILNNAIKYSPGKNVVYFDIRGCGNDVFFTVKDEGVGIKEEDRPRIFDAFYRADDVKHIQGTGLGLSIVKRAVELLNGNLRVESEAGGGSAFIVRLPVQ